MSKVYFDSFIGKDWKAATVSGWDMSWKKPLSSAASWDEVQWEGINFDIAVKPDGTFILNLGEGNKEFNTQIEVLEEIQREMEKIFGEGR